MIVGVFFVLISFIFMYVCSISFLVVFFLFEKNYLMLSLAMSVRPSLVENTLERGCSITNRPIDLKFGLIIGGRVMQV